MQPVRVSQKISEVLSQRRGETPLEDSFFVVDIPALRAQFDLWRAHLPAVTPHYAVKCNNHPAILRRLVEWGVNFDCASENEVRLAEKAGAAPSQIIYANPVKAPSQLRYASERGVRRMTFDNLVELDKVKQVAPQSELLLRIKTDDSGAICSLSCKFGAALVQAEELLAHARALGLNVVGVAYHVGSGGGTGPQAHAKALADARAVFDTAAKIGYRLQVVDVGGGFEAPPADFIPVADEIKRSFAALRFPAGTQLIGEPGRFFAAPVMTLVACVIGVRAAPAGDEPDMAYLTDGVYGNLNSIIYDHQHPKSYLVGEDPADAASTTRQRTSLWGPTCDGLDSVDSGAVFPRRLRLGDWLYFPDAGAYTLVGESAFNGFNTNTQFFVVETDTD